MGRPGASVAVRVEQRATANARSDAPLGRISASRLPCASRSRRPKWAWPCLQVKKGAALRRRGPLGRLERQASRAACKADRALRKPAVRRPRRRCRRGAAASAGGSCTRARAGEYEARRLLVLLEEAAAAHIHRARHDLRRGRRRALAGLRVAGAEEQAGVGDAGGRGARARGGGGATLPVHAEHEPARQAYGSSSAPSSSC